VPLYTDIASLSQTPASNAADGTTDAPSTIDNNMNLLASFIAKLRDGAGYTAGAIAAALGYTPVQQGTGTSQLPNTVKIGWSASSQLRAQVDATDFGVNWPINVTGNAATVGSLAAAEFVRRTTANAMTLTWDNVNGYVYPSVDGIPQSAYVIWNKVQGKPTDLASFSNSPGYQTAAQLTAYAVQRLQGVISLENIAGGTSGMAVQIGGGIYLNWGVTVSDASLKENIQPTTQDSLAKVRRMSFKSFNFVPGHDDGHEHKSGLVAQDLEAIDPELVDNSGTWKQPRLWEHLCVALHAIQQLEAKVAALEARP
jgi:hypothetical protein